MSRQDITETIKRLLFNGYKNPFLFCIRIISAVFNALFALKQRFSIAANGNYSNDAELNPLHAIGCKREVYFLISEIYSHTHFLLSASILSVFSRFKAINDGRMWVSGHTRGGGQCRATCEITSWCNLRHTRDVEDADPYKLMFSRFKSLNFINGDKT